MEDNRPGKLPCPPLPEGLKGRILMAIEARRRLTARVHSLIWGALGLGSLTVAAFSLQSTWGQLGQSGFGYYFALLFSDGGSLVASWKELLLTITESLPLFGLTVFLAAVWALLESIKGLLTNYRNMSLPVNLAK